MGHMQNLAVRALLVFVLIYCQCKVILMLKRNDVNHQNCAQVGCKSYEQNTESKSS